MSTVHGPRLRVCLWVLLVLLAECFAGCAAKHVVAPASMPAYPGKPASYENVTLVLRQLTVSGRTDKDTDADVAALRGVLLSYAERMARFRSVVDATTSPGQPEWPAIFLDVDLDVSHSRWRTFVLDAPFFYPMPGYWPITPQWGSAMVRASAFGFDAEGTEVWRNEQVGTAPYWMIFYSWYRTAPIEEAYAAAYAKAFTATLQGLAESRDAVTAALEKRPPALAALVTEKIAVLPTQIDASCADQVPKLFDDYLLSAVQSASGTQVVGQSDINAMLSMEAQKDLMGCSDAVCFAEVGGALGVDLAISIQVANVGGNWVTTAKIINMRRSRVESRVSDMQGGGVKELLERVPSIVRQLFAQRRTGSDS